jgi:signal transduction histidine kinase
MSIRARLIFSFIVFFILSTTISIGVFWMLSEIEKKIEFLEVANRYMVEIQQARRFEKNYLLYGTNLEDVSEHLDVAENMLSDHKVTIEKILGNDHFKTMNNYLSKYQSQINLLEKGSSEKLNTRILRESGSRMITFAEEFVNKEREDVSRLLNITKKTPIVFTVCLILFMAFLFSVLMNQLFFTLKEFMIYTKRVGDGDFSPIQFKKSTKNEFFKLAQAFNHMVKELNHRYEILVESQKLRAIGTLVAGVAHELNNPLNNSMLTASILKEDYEDLDDPDKKEMIDDLIHETERSQRIVRDLLDFARENKITMKPLEINTIIKDSLRLVANQIKIGKVRLQLNIENALPMIHGDEQMLKQVFVNIILNAVDALPEKGIINVSSMKNMHQGFLGIKIKDNGPGIPDHLKNRIFEPFFTTKQKGRGVGLGLSVTMGIIKKHSGFIEFSSSGGHGTEFNIFLPVTEIPSKKMMSQEDLD